MTKEEEEKKREEERKVAGEGYDEGKGADKVPYYKLQKERQKKEAATKELEALKTQLADIESNKQKDADTKLLDEKKYKELHEKTKQVLATLQDQYTGLQKEFVMYKRAESVRVEVQKLNPHNMDDVLKFVDLDALPIEDDKVDAQALSRNLLDIAKAKPYLFQDVQNGGKKAGENDKLNPNKNTKDITKVPETIQEKQAEFNRVVNLGNTRTVQEAQSMRALSRELHADREQSAKGE